MAPVKGRNKNGYKMPEPLPKGLILQDIAKKRWQLGPSIGKGGFGEIYSAQVAGTSPGRGKYPYVIKIEPHGNGPLFVEINFYIRNAKPADEFKSLKKLSFLGMPEYIGSGSHHHKDEKYRFLVMQKFGTDIWKLFLENHRKFPESTVFQLGVQVLDVLEYIHSKGYSHGDVKGANILLASEKSPKNVYLVDFGLCSKLSTTFKPDPKSAHNGTIEYLSRDAHLGIQSTRGDLEILGYNLIQWLGCTLPWEKLISNPVSVQNSKETYMGSITVFLSKCFATQQPPVALVNYLKYVANLEFNGKVDYKKLRNYLISGMESAGGSLKTPLAFKTPSKRKSVNSPAAVEKKVVKKQSEEEPEATVSKPAPVRKRTKKSVPTKSVPESNGTPVGFTPEMLRLQSKIQLKKQAKVTVKKQPKVVAKVGTPIKLKTRTSITPRNSPLRKRKPINYNESLRSANRSVDIISESD